jgi:ATP-dependent RNA helicase DHX57
MDILYNPDPFAAMDLNAEMEKVKRKEFQEKQDSRTTHNSPWLKYSVLEISKELRDRMEEAIKANLDVVQVEDSNQQDSEKYITSKLVSKGFLPFHINEALLHRKTLQGVLDWLCLHVPEQDLPVSVRPNDSNRMEHQVLTTEELSQEYIIRRLVEFGFSRNICQAVLEETKEEMAAVTTLCWSLIYFEKEKSISLSLEEFDELIEEEKNVLDSIYDDTVSFVKSPGGATFTYLIESNKQTLKIDIIISQSCNYPHNPPAIIVTNDSTPAYIRLSLMQQAILESINYRSNAMVFSILSWISDNCQRIIDNPQSLTSIKICIENLSLKLQNSPFTSKSVQKNSKTKSNLFDKSDSNTNFRMSEYKKTQMESKNYLDMLEKRMKLPAYALKDRICKLLETNQVLLICGETGCGKST